MKLKKGEFLGRTTDEARAEDSQQVTEYKDQIRNEAGEVVRGE